MPACHRLFLAALFLFAPAASVLSNAIDAPLDASSTVDMSGSVPPELQQALTLAVTGKPDDAGARAKAWIDSNPGSRSQAAAYEVLGVALYIQGHTDASVAALKQSIALDPTRSSPMTKLGSIELDGGQLPQARRDLKRAIVLNAGDRLAHQRLGTILAQQGDPAGAIRQYQLGLAGAAPDSIGTKLRLAQLYNHEHRFDDAIALLAVATPMGSGSVPELLTLGTAYMGKSDLADALTEFQAAHTRDPKDANAALAVGIAHRESGQADAAAAAINQAIALRPDWAQAYYQLGLTDLALQNYDGGRAAFQKAASLSPQTTDIERSLAEVAALSGPADAAISSFTALTRRDDAHLGDFVVLAIAYQAVNKVADADLVYRNALKRFPRDPDAYWRLGSIQALERQYPAALKTLDDGLALAPNDARMLRDKAEVQGRLGLYQDAFATADRLVATAPQNPDLLFLRAALLQDSGAVAAATSAYRDILTAAPDYPWALNNLAALLTDAGQAQAALPYARHAAELRPRNSAVQDTLGWALLQAGQPDNAVTALTKARDLAPQSAEAFYRLAVAQRQAGDRVAAGQNLRKAIALTPDFRDARAASALQVELAK